MVIEHSFVTTLEAPEAMLAAAEFLGEFGFENEAGRAFAVGQTTFNRLELRRGKKARRAKNVAELPQRAHLEYDRGRVTVALSIQPSTIWGGSSWSLQIGFVDDAMTKENPKKMKLHTQLLMSIARGLEMLLAQKLPPEQSRAEWERAEEQIRHAARKRRVRQWIIVGCVLLVFAGLITLIAMNVK